GVDIEIDPELARAACIGGVFDDGVEKRAFHLIDVGDKILNDNEIGVPQGVIRIGFGSAPQPARIPDRGITETADFVILDLDFVNAQRVDIECVVDGAKVIRVEREADTGKNYDDVCGRGVVHLIPVQGHLPLDSGFNLVLIGPAAAFDVVNDPNPDRRVSINLQPARRFSDDRGQCFARGGGKGQAENIECDKSEQ